MLEQAPSSRGVRQARLARACCTPLMRGERRHQLSGRGSRRGCWHLRLAPKRKGFARPRLLLDFGERANVLVHRPPEAVRCNVELGISTKRRFSVSRVQCLLERTAMVPWAQAEARQEVFGSNGDLYSGSGMTRVLKQPC